MKIQKDFLEPVLYLVELKHLSMCKIGISTNFFSRMIQLEYANHTGVTKKFIVRGMTKVKCFEIEANIKAIFSNWALEYDSNTEYYDISMLEPIKTLIEKFVPFKLEEVESFSYYNENGILMSEEQAQKYNSDIKEYELEFKDGKYVIEDHFINKPRQLQIIKVLREYQDQNILEVDINEVYRNSKFDRPAKFIVALQKLFYDNQIISQVLINSYDLNPSINKLNLVPLSEIKPKLPYKGSSIFIN